MEHRGFLSVLWLVIVMLTVGALMVGEVDLLPERSARAQDIPGMPAGESGRAVHL